MKLHFLLIHPTHYFGFLLSHLNKTVGKSTPIKVHFLNEVNKIYPWQSNFRNGYESRVLQGRFFEAELLKNIINEKKSTFILVGWESWDKIILIFLMGLLQRKYLIYTDTLNTEKSRNQSINFIRNSILKFISLTSAGIVTTGTIGVDKILTLPYKFKHVFNLPFFVDLEYFTPLAKKEYKEENKIVFFSSGRLDNNHKGFDLAIHALGRLKKEKKITNFSYLIAGEGPDKKVLEQIIINNNLSNEVVLLGWAEPHLLVNYYQKSDIFLHPSHFDPFPNAVLEAMSCGMVVLASNKAGSAIDRIDHGLNGFLFQAGNLEDLMNNILFLYENRLHLSNYSTAARETSMKWPISNSEEIIKEILKETHAK